jgi:hypothetical protein
MAQQTGFPSSLDQTPPAERLTEVFGLVPPLFGVGLIGFCVALLVTLWPITRSEWDDVAIAVAIALVGIACWVYEIYRRLRRTSLFLQGARIGIYRGRAFSEETSLAQVVEYKLNHENTFKMATGPLVIGGTLLYLSLQPAKGLSRLFLAGIGSLLVGLAISVLVTRFACRHFFIPKGNKRETIMLSKAQAERLLASLLFARP